ncbi:MAG: hypothetical protein CVV44_17930 [Spirochaetae bacterium HGW-Spirochaetae-1]|nr:MAG: hypothetical protein CVV44_17930 [Spirochaetae bacterium HGW-Spirochaetae-1]
MTILLDQLKKISTFAFLLAILFFVNILFNVNFKWSGISLIVRVYIFLFSFFMIYNFSLIEIEEKKKEYREKYGRLGAYYLFVAARLVPFVIIYAITVIFTLIDYIGRPGWFINSIIDLLKGKYANMVIYSLILLIILKIRRDPLITIPLFLAASMFYLLVLDKMIYNYSSEGIAISIIKIVKYIMFVFLLIFEFFFEKKKIKIPAIVGTIFGILIHCIVTVLIYLFYIFSPAGSHAQLKSARLLLHSGFSFPFTTMVDEARKQKAPYVVRDVITYSELYKLKINMSDGEWENIISESSLATVELICTYLMDMNKLLSYEVLMAYAEKKSSIHDKQLAISEHFVKYMALYVPDKREDFQNRISRGNIVLMLWGIQVLGEARSRESMPFLINCLTDMNTEISVAAYRTLTEITGIDPAQKENFHANIPAVIGRFRQFYLDYRKGLQ